MCTAVTLKTKDFYFGRNLDYSFSYNEEVVIMPRRHPLEFAEMGRSDEHYAIIGTAFVVNGTPLYYDGVNDKGLGMAGLNFVGNACYNSHVDGKDNVAQYELITYILSRCASVEEAKKALSNMNILNTPFNEKLPPAQLHWIIADKSGSITVESVKEGLMVYDNPIGVLTNNPPFPYQIFYLNNFRNLSAVSGESAFAPGLKLDEYSRGMGAIGLPGDISSQSRFVRAAFTKLNSVCGEGEKESVSQFFHILHSVDNVRGCCRLKEDEYEMTIYSSCCNADKGIYYYTTYDNHQITGVDMHHEDLDGTDIYRYPFVKGEQINMQN